MFTQDDTNSPFNHLIKLILVFIYISSLPKHEIALF